MSLTPAQINVLRHAPFVGFRPGSNLWSEVAYTRGGNLSDVLFDGEEVEPLVRRGLLKADALDAVKHVEGEHSELGKVEVTHRYVLTDDGREALANQN